MAEGSPRFFDKYLDILCARPAPGELASFPQSANHDLSDAPTSTPNWPPTGGKTGRPLYFVGWPAEAKMSH